MSQASGDTHVAANTLVKANSGRAILGLAETASTDGAWGLYSAASGQLTRYRGLNGTAGGNYASDKSVDFASDDAQAFLPTTAAMHVRTLSGAWVVRYGEGGSTPGTFPIYARQAPNYVAADGLNKRLYLSQANSNQVKILALPSRARIGARASCPLAHKILSSTKPKRGQDARASSATAFKFARFLWTFQVHTAGSSVRNGPKAKQTNLRCAAPTRFPCRRPNLFALTSRLTSA